MKKIMSLLLAVVLVLSLAACTGGNNPTTEPTTEPTTAPTTEPTTAPTTEPTTAPTTEPTTADVTLSMISLFLGENYISISDDYAGGLAVDYSNNGIRKVTTLDMGVLADIQAQLAASGLMDLLGTSEYGDTEDSASFSMVYSDWSSQTADYYGVETPEAFTTGFNAIAAYMETLLADVPEYVPQAMVMGEVDADILTAMQEIMNNSGIANLDSLGIQGIPMDEYFGMTAGLSDAEGITAAAVCQTMMMGGAAYQLVIVTLEDEANAADVAADFEACMNWDKWVCVRPTDAMIAQKGNMVLCLMGPDTMYSGTAAAIQNAGWTVVKTLTDPGM